jgi:hypothetical protein
MTVRAVAVTLTAAALALAGAAPAGATNPQWEVWNAPALSAGQIVSDSFPGDAVLQQHWFRFRATAGTPINITATPASPGCMSENGKFSLLDMELINPDASSTYSGKEFVISWTGQQAGDYYIEATYHGSGGCAYSFTTPGGALSPITTKLGLAEPNDTPESANGPLRADIRYEGTIETSNDIDWVYFWGRAGQQVTADLAGGGCDVLYTLDGYPGSYGNPGPMSGGIFTSTTNQIFANRATWSLEYTGALRLGFRGAESYNVGCKWALTLGGAVLKQNPRICDNARAAATRAKSTYNRHKRLAARHRKHKSLISLKRKLNTAKKIATLRCAAERA